MQEYTENELLEIAKDLIEKGWGEWYYDKDGELSLRLTPKGRKFGAMLLRQQAHKNNQPHTDPTYSLFGPLSHKMKQLSIVLGLLPTYYIRHRLKMSKPLKRLNRIASRIGACVEYTDGMYEVYFFSRNMTYMFDNPSEVKGFLLMPEFPDTIVEGVYEEDDHVDQKYIIGDVW